MVQATPLLRPYNLAGPMVLEGVLVDKGFMYRQRLEDWGKGVRFRHVGRHTGVDKSEGPCITY